MKNIVIINGEEILVDASDETIQLNKDDLRQKLSDTDYKVIKCYEYQLMGEELPYDIQALHAERQTLRDQINSL